MYHHQTVHYEILILQPANNRLRTPTPDMRCARSPSTQSTTLCPLNPKLQTQNQSTNFSEIYSLFLVIYLMIGNVLAMNLFIGIFNPKP